MKIGIVIVCTNSYFVLGVRFVKQLIEKYVGSNELVFYMFTDTDPSLYLPDGTPVKYYHTVHTNWVDGTNSKFSNILKLKDEAVDYLYYFDADTSVSRSFTEEWFLGELVGGEHYNNGWNQEKPFDRNPKSKAYVPVDTPLPQMYYYGAFFGGLKENVIQFCAKLVSMQEEDRLIKYEPVWNDESYINCHFHYNPPTFVVRSNKFAFIISDKGGIGETRNSLLDVSELKQAILLHKDDSYTFRSGKISVKNMNPTPSLTYMSLNLQSIQTIVLHNRSETRKNHMNKCLTEKGLQYSLFECIKDDNKLCSGIRSLIEIFSSLLERPSFEPVLFLEDNVSTTDAYRNELSVPTNSDCVYLGLSTCCSGGGYTTTVPWNEIGNPDMIQIKDMLSMHAFVILSERWLRVLLETLKSIMDNPQNYDIPIAQKMKDYNVYGMKRPFFYQDAAVGGQQAPTKITFDDIKDRVLQ